MTATTIEDLCRAIDAGDDAVLPILADALEEAGIGYHRHPGPHTDGLWRSRQGWWASARQGKSLYLGMSARAAFMALTAPI